MAHLFISKISRNFACKAHVSAAGLLILVRLAGRVPETAAANDDDTLSSDCIYYRLFCGTVVYTVLLLLYIVTACSIGFVNGVQTTVTEMLAESSELECSEFINSELISTEHVYTKAQYRWPSDVETTVFDNDRASILIDTTTGFKEEADPPPYHHEAPPVPSYACAPLRYTSPLFSVIKRTEAVKEQLKANNVPITNRLVPLSGYQERRSLGFKPYKPLKNELATISEYELSPQPKVYVTTAAKAQTLIQRRRRQSSKKHRQRSVSDGSSNDSRVVHPGDTSIKTTNQEDDGKDQNDSNTSITMPKLRQDENCEPPLFSPVLPTSAATTNRRRRGRRLLGSRYSSNPALISQSATLSLRERLERAIRSVSR